MSENKPTLRERIDGFLENYHYKTLAKQDLLDIKADFLNLLKEELEGLTVLPDRDINKALGYMPRPAPQAGSLEIANGIWVAKAQLSHNVKELEEKTG